MNVVLIRLSSLDVCTKTPSINSIAASYSINKKNTNCVTHRKGEIVNIFILISRYRDAYQIPRSVFRPRTLLITSSDPVQEVKQATLSEVFRRASNVGCEWSQLALGPRFLEEG
jgi:hypothetical protein